MVGGRPRRVAKTFVDTWNSGDARALAALFTHEADFVNSNGAWWRNRDAVRGAFEGALDAAFREKHLERRKTRVKHLTPDIATVHLHWMMQAEGPDNRRPECEGVLLFVMVRDQQDGWRIQTVQNTEIADRPSARVP